MARRVMANFYINTIRNDKRFNSEERIDDINLLEPVTRKIVQNIIEQARLNGLELMVFETYRSQQRQALLYAQGQQSFKMSAFIIMA
jgi:D-alanyl-D-alanine dipeptidase